MRTGVFVLGMHRSGTSAATRLVNLLGIPGPVGDDLLPPDDGNPTGYWESASLVAFNDEVLASLGSDMTCPRRLSAGWERHPRLDALRREAAEAFNRAFPDRHWVFKDPRNCITFPFWVRALGLQPVVILIHRNPFEIAASSRTHWGGPEEVPFLLALWERYLRQALTSIERAPVLVTQYDDLVGAPVEWSESAARFLREGGITVRDPEEETILEFVDPRLRHASSTRSEFLESAAVTDAQRALFLALEDLNGAHGTFAAPALPPETATTDALLAERRKALGFKRALPAERLSRARQRVRRSAYFAPARRIYNAFRSLAHVTTP